jgi:outer membrane protein OmpA-like peptidoglycan-associated protein
VSRRFWRRAATAARPGGSAWVAALGLVASFAVGYFVLVPRIEPDVAAWIGREAGQSDVAAVPVAPASTAAESQPSAVPEARAAAEAGIEADASPQSERPSPVPASADYCHDAMVAALGNARIEFLSASAEIVPASRNVVSVLAALAHTCPGRIVVDGHSDNLGAESINERISLERAQSVVAAFVEFGIEPQRLEARGFGSSRPLADNATAAGRARNRRIEMSLVEQTSPPQRGE